MKQRFVTALLAAAGCAVLMTGCGTRSKEDSARDSAADRTESMPSAVDPTDSLLSDAEGIVSDVIDGGEDIVSDIASDMSDSSTESERTTSDRRDQRGSRESAAETRRSSAR